MVVMMGVQNTAWTSKLQRKRTNETGEAGNHAHSRVILTMIMGTLAIRKVSRPGWEVKYMLLEMMKQQ